MKTTKTSLYIWVLTSVTTVAFARGFGGSDGPSRTSYGNSFGGGQDSSAPRPSGSSRGDYSAPANAAPTPSYTPRSAPSQAPSYTPPARSVSGPSSSGPIREQPAPQVRTYTPPEPQVRTYTPPAPQVRSYTPTEPQVRTHTPSAPQVRTYTPPEPQVRTYTPPAPQVRSYTPTPQSVNEDNARNSGTPRGGSFQTRPESVGPVAPTVTPRTPVTAPVERTQPRITERPQPTHQAPFGSQQRSSPPTTVTAPSANTARSGAGSRNAGDNTPSYRPPTRDAAPTTSARSQAHDAPPVAPSRGQAGHTPFRTIATPDTRLTSPQSARGTANMNFGSASDNMHARNAKPSAAGAGLRSTRPGGDEIRGGRNPGDSSASPAGRNSFASSSPDRNRPSGSRYGDGRSSVYRAPERHAPIETRSAYYHDYHGGDHHDYHGGDHHPQPYHYNPYACRYDHHAFSPVWCGPVVYPAGNYFGFSWWNGSFGLSFASYSPSYAYSTRYYDSWSCGGWGYSGVYYGGWHNNWYGGFSYVYNPWPVYRTYYLYDPEPIVIPAQTVYVTQPPQTVYVTQPAQTVYVTQPATTTYVVQSAAEAPVVQQAAPVAAAPLQAQTAWDVAPAVEQAETVATSCFCPCHCNGQRPCTCEYPCGSEYAVQADQFDLSLVYSPYSETLNPETIWSSYAGLDRETSYTDPNLYDATVSTGDRR